MPEHDPSYKRLFSHPRMVEDLLRGFVAEDWVEQIDFSTLETVNPSTSSGQETASSATIYAPGTTTLFGKRAGAELIYTSFCCWNSNHRLAESPRTNRLTARLHDLVAACTVARQSAGYTFTRND